MVSTFLLVLHTTNWPSVGEPPAQICQQGVLGTCQRREGNDGMVPRIQAALHLEEHPALKFHEAIVGHSVREITFEVDTDKVKVIVLEIVECAKVEHNQDGHNLAV